MFLTKLFIEHFCDELSHKKLAKPREDILNTVNYSAYYLVNGTTVVHTTCHLGEGTTCEVLWRNKG